MKIAMINDQHFGVRNDSTVFANMLESFYTETFFPTLEEKGITQVVVLGDIFDRRKYINYQTLDDARRMFFNPLAARGIKVDILLGNHDVYYKNTNDVNSPELLLGEYDNITVYKNPEVVSYGTAKVGIVPWINSENYERSMAFIKDRSNGADILMGHFEINGFEMYKGGGECRDGLPMDVFKDYEYVFSGHFHQPSKQGSIAYLGSPGQFTWSDYGCARGFNIFDTETRDIEYVQNPFEMFHKVYYDESIDVMEYDYELLSGKIVRVIVGEKESAQKFDLFIDKVQKSAPFQLDVVDNTQYHYIEDGIDEEAIKSEDTMSIVNSYIEGLDTLLDADKMKAIFKRLYVEAMSEVDYE